MLVIWALQLKLSHWIECYECVCVAAKDVFKLLNSKYKKIDLTVGASFFEIYSGKVSEH